MKKIKNKSDLVAQKMRLRVKELELENAIRNNWHGLKDDLKLKNLVKHNLTEPEKNESNEDRHWLVNGLGIGASILTNKLLNNAGDKIEGQVNRGVDKFLNKVQGIMERKKNKKT